MIVKCKVLQGFSGPTMAASAGSIIELEEATAKGMVIHGMVEIIGGYQTATAPQQGKQTANFKAKK